MLDSSAIKAIDRGSVHQITSGQVVIDLQTAAKELVENSLDAGATSIEVRFKQYGLKSIEVIDNGSGIAEEYHENIALKHYTSKLSSFADLSTIRTFGFRGEALSSLCALSESILVTTATTPPMGVSLEMDANGKVQKKHKVARQRGTTVMITNLFLPLPVRRKEFDRNSKREFGKALALLNAYALGPCCNAGAGVRLTVTNHIDKGQRSVQLRTTGATSSRASVSALWGSKALDNIVDLDLNFEVERDRVALKRLNASSQPGPAVGDDNAVPVIVKGLISKFSIGAGRTGTDRQFFYINGRPCNLTKIQKSFNEVYRSFNANQSPFILANFIIPTDTCDINVSPDKRTIFLHSEGSLITKLKTALEEAFAPSRSTYNVGGTRSQSQTQRKTDTQTMLSLRSVSVTQSGKETEKSILAANSKTGQGNNDTTTITRCPGLQQRQSSVETETAAYAGPQRCSDNPSPIPRTFESIPSVSVHQRLSSPSPPFQDIHPQSPTVSQILESHHHHRWQAPTPMDVDDLTSPQVQCPDKVLSPTVSQMSASCQHRRPGPGDLMDVGVGADVYGQGEAGVGPFFPSITGEGVTPEGSHDTQVTEIIDPREREAAVVVDTSTAVWNRMSKEGTPADAEDGKEAEEEDGPVRKKRKSELGAEIELTEKVASTDVAEKDSGIGSLKQLGKGMMVVESEKKKRKASVARDNKREQLRDRLVRFARSGSHVPAVEHLEEEEEDADMDEDEGGRSGEEEVDQLDASDDTKQDETPTPNKKQALFNESRPSTPEAETNMQAVTGESSTSAIDLTSGGDMFDDLQLDVPVLDPVQHIPSSTLRQEEIITRPEVLRSACTGDVSLRFDLSKITAAWSHFRDRLSTASASSTTATDDASGSRLRVPSDAGVLNTENDDRAVDALSRVIEKQDFATMDVVGQFNLGFIVARRRKPVAIVDGQIGTGEAVMDDLFIVDQHAADEKYNFETLQQTTSIKSQRLFRPQAMELMASDELVAMENIDVLKKNGFEVDVDSEGPGECGKGSRLRLTAQPVSKSTVFNIKDLEELIHLMRDRPAGQMVRCSKARAMFAMRACRKSVMIGMPLNRKQMSLVVQHMGTIDQPWNCPHGRPTMRHLIDIASVTPNRHVMKVDWSSAFCGI